MPRAQRLVQPLRVRDDDSASEPYSDELGGSSRSPSILSTGSAGDVGIEGSALEDEDGEDDEEEDSGLGDDQGKHVKDRLSNISFGTLVKAQDSLDSSAVDRKRKRGQDKSNEHEDKLQQLRDRLRELREGKSKLGASNGSSKSKATAAGHKLGKAKQPIASQSEDKDDEDDDSDDSSVPDDEEDLEGTKKRKSKHAPAEVTSRKQVSRARPAFEVPRRPSRDPRFDSMSGSNHNAAVLSKNYAFLHDYRANEIATMKAAIKASKNADGKKLTADEVERLRIQVTKLEDKEREVKRHEREKEVLREHKKAEREAIKSGKQPFYLKRSEQKKLVVVDRFENMKAKQRDKAIERRRKKVSGREKKNMPAARRGFE